MKRMKMIVNDDSIIRIYRFLMLLEVIEEVKENAFKVVVIEVISKDELSDICIDDWTNFGAFEMVSYSSYFGVDIENEE